MGSVNYFLEDHWLHRLNLKTGCLMCFIRLTSAVSRSGIRCLRPHDSSNVMAWCVIYVEESFLCIFIALDFKF